jgi:peptidoglycan/xylan/chitin deacetylase (PgdA/CDA1 family)
MSGRGLVTLTFDDASRSQLERGLPVLERSGVKGVLFVPTGLLGTWFEREPLLTLSGVGELAAAGWEVGSHTVSHTRLAKDGRTLVPPSDLEAELRDSRAFLRARGFPAVSLAYPYGRFNGEVEALAGRLYRYVRTTADGLNPIAARNPRVYAFTLNEERIRRWRRAAARAAQGGSWLVGTVHHVARSASEIPPDDRRSWITEAGLEECVTSALDAGLAPRTFRQVQEEAA